MSKKDKLIKKILSRPKDFTFKELLDYQVNELIKHLYDEGAI